MSILEFIFLFWIIEICYPVKFNIKITDLLTYINKFGKVFFKKIKRNIYLYMQKYIYTMLKIQYFSS